MFFPPADIQLLLERRIDFTAVSAVEFLCILCHITVQFVHVDVCQDRADDGALRGTGISIVIIPILHISSFQELPEQTDEMFICNPLSQNSNQHMMVYVVKTALYIPLNEPLCPRKIFLHIFECRMTASVYTETVGIVAKGWLINTL